MKRKLFHIVLPLVLLVLLIFSVVVNIVVLKKLDSMHILGYEDLRLDGLTPEAVTEVYLCYDWLYPPEYEGVVTDDDILPQVLAILETGGYLEIPDPNIDYTVPGAGAGPYVKFTTDEDVYTISFNGSYLIIRVSGETKWYEASCWRTLRDYLVETAKPYFFD